jgi:hypothetical protein
VIQHVRLRLFDRDGEELMEHNPVTGTLELTAEGTVLTYPVAVLPASLRYIEFIPDVMDPAGVAPERELVGA